MTNKAIYVQPSGGFDRVTLGTSEPSPPKAGEITVRIRASSLNYHDYAVVSGMWAPAAPRVPMSDGYTSLDYWGCTLERLLLNKIFLFYKMVEKRCYP